MKSVRKMFWLTLLSLSAAADPLHEIEGGNHQHEDSLWIFKKEIAGFTMVAEPYTVDGTTHVSVEYHHVASGKRSTAVVHVYPPVAPAANMAEVKSRLTKQWKATPQPEQAIPVSSREPRLQAAKTPFASAALYVIDTGPWIVRIEAAGESTDLAALDAFVREQQWDSFQLTPESCTGSACVGS